jgi:hypothetical protein
LLIAREPFKRCHACFSLFFVGAESSASNASISKTRARLNPRGICTDFSVWMPCIRLDVDQLRNHRFASDCEMPIPCGLYSSISLLEYGSSALIDSSAFYRLF